MIAPGDLVIVVGSICKCQRIDLNLILEVKALSFEGTQCILCGRVDERTMTAELHFGGRKAWKPLHYLRKINPPAKVAVVDEEAFA